MEPEPNKREGKVFDPSAPAYRWRLWVKYYSAQKGGKYRHVYWGRVWILVGILGIGGWLGLTAAAWSWVRYERGFIHARYVNLVIPWRWPAYLHGLSADYLARGEAEMAAAQWNPALTDLTAALSLDSDNLATRRTVGQQEFKLGLGPAAVATLRDGAKAAYRSGDEAYLRDFFAAALASGAPEEALTVGRSLLPLRYSHNRLPLFVAYQTAVALARMKRYADAVQVLRTWDLPGCRRGWRCGPSATGTPASELRRSPWPRRG